jgi:hypothetical protein
MKVENPMAQDSFEAARKAFFGAGRTTPTLRLSPADPLVLRDAPSAEKVLPSKGSISPAAGDHAAREVAREGDAQWEWLLCLASTFRALRNNAAPQ